MSQTLSARVMTRAHTNRLSRLTSMAGTVACLMLTPSIWVMPMWWCSKPKD